MVSPYDALDRLGRSPRALVIAISVIVLCSIGLVDYVTGYDRSLSVFYLLPILLITWRLGRAAGILMSLCSGFVWCLAEESARRQGYEGLGERLKEGGLYTAHGVCQAIANGVPRVMGGALAEAITEWWAEQVR